MPKRRSLISAVRTLLYTAAKFLGDISAVRKGPNAIVKRLARAGGADDVADAVALVSLSLRDHRQGGLI
jgi:hypothetical protein